MKVNFLYYLLFSFFLISCSNQPNDLENRKDKINSSLDELARRDPSTADEVERLVSDYNSLKSEIIDYTAEANRRGINKNNDAAINDINQRLQGLERVRRQTSHETFQTDLNRLYSEFKSNNVSFFEKYEDKRAVFSATIKEVSRWNMPEGYKVTVDVDDNWTGVDCFFPDSEKSSVSNLSVGQSATISGDVGEGMMHTLSFYQCKLN